MLVTGEHVGVVGQSAAPREAVKAVRFALGRHFDELVESGDRPDKTNGQLQLNAFVPALDAEGKSATEDTEAWDQHIAGGSIDGLRIRRDAQTGAVVFASMHGSMPARLSDEETGSGVFRADTWNTRLHLPSKHNRAESQRLVVDSWQTPLTHLTLAANALTAARSPEREAAYDELYALICKREDAAGRPLGAIAISHDVYGRGDFMRGSEIAKINAVMDTFAAGVRQAVAWNEQLTAQLAVEER